MVKMKKYDIETLERYHSEGLLEKNEHPSLPLIIWNYSRECQYEGRWDGITLNMRGTITDREGNIVASAFPKFFNYEEVPDKVPVNGDYVYVQEKMDGSLGILFWYEGEWHLATKGSFASDQAKRGMEILKKKYNLEAFHTHVTYLCEIIYPDNMIVVNYKGQERIVFIGATSNGEEFHWSTAEMVFLSSGIKRKDIVKTEQHFQFGRDLYKRLKELNTQNSEGFVLRFHPGNFRMKIKFEEYVRLHSLLTSFSNLDIWRFLMSGKDPEELLVRVPDEFDLWVRENIRKLKEDYSLIEEEGKKITEIVTKGEPSRKEIAEILRRTVNRTAMSIVFNMLDGKDYSEIIWKSIRPKYQKPFWQRIE
jgi:hypothetical protein